MSDSPSLLSAVEPHSSDGLNCDKAAQCENKEEKEPDDQPEVVASSPQMNVIVKEEEEEEPLCGT